MAFTREDIVGVVQGVWSTMLSAEVAEAPAARPGTADHGVLRGTIAISGGWHGTLVLELAASEAQAAACIMLDLKPGEASDDDAREIVSELTNIVGGNVKALLESPSKLGLPAVERIAGPAWPGPVAGESERHAFSWDGACFWLAVVAQDA